MNRSSRETIFQIQRFCAHDGDGIRTTVFFKGCPLRCRWCHNPEGLHSRIQLGFNPELCILGKRIGKDIDFAPRTGIAIERPGLLLRKSAYENMKTLAALTKRPSSEEINRLIQIVGLDPTEKKLVGKYSMGMKQRLSIAMALMDNPDILLLDEPMSNLDITGAAQMRALYQELAHRGKTILIATHVQEDVTELCSRMCRIENGRASIECMESSM